MPFTLSHKPKKTGNKFVAGFTIRSLLPVVTTLSSQFIASTLALGKQKLREPKAENMPVHGVECFRALSDSVAFCPKLLFDRGRHA